MCKFLDEAPTPYLRK